MIQEVAFQGLTHSPSDSQCQDGELGTCLNLIPEDGELHPINKPIVAEEYITIPEGETIELVHKVTHNETIHSHYIVHKSDDTWYWMEKGGDGTKNTIDLNGFHVNTVTSVGNILCFVGDIQTKYAFWVSANYTIFDLSDFDFQICIEPQKIYLSTGFYSWKLGDNFSDYFIKERKEDKLKITGMDVTHVNEVFNQFDSHLNKILSEKDDKLMKYFVFGVAAVRLYDGTHINISNIFRLGDSKSTISHFDVDINSKTIFFLGVRCCSYAIKILMDKKKEIKDLIQGVDIYLSKPESFVDLNERTADYVESEKDGSDEGTMYFSMQDNTKAAITIDSMSFFHSIFIDKEDFGTKQILKRISGTELSISLANLNRKNFGGGCSITYNNRLHIGNIKDGLPNKILTNFDTVIDRNVETTTITGYMNFKTNNIDIWIKDDAMFRKLNFFICLPMSDVTELTIYRIGTYGYEKSIAKLHSSDSMSFSYYVTGNGGKEIPSFDLQWENIDKTEWNKAMNLYNNRENVKYIYNYTSVIKVSEAENPLVFPAKNTVQVGSSIVNALAANTRPISEGQFGEAPLYAFTDEGVWMLMTSTDGTYIARQPVNREICTNPKGILQTDDAVLFATDRGIMLQQGREAICITDVLNGYPFDFTQVYSHSKADKTYPSKLLALANIPDSSVKYDRFRNYLQAADMIYDYYDSRIIVFNPAYTYAYVYSLNSKMWGAMDNVFRSRVNVYPESYAVGKDGKVLDVYVKNPTEDVKYFICSRPISLGQKDIHKTIFSCVARGYLRPAESGKCGMVILGSNDLFQWFYIGSSKDTHLYGLAGSPFKYFRIAMIGSLNVDESIRSVIADLQPRWQNKIR